MPDLGDYVTRLIADSSKYSSGVQQAVGSNRELSGSVQSIIGQLTRQQRALETAGRSTLDWIEADKKASAESKEFARNLLEQVNALKSAKSATDALAAADAKRQSEAAKTDSMISRLGSWQRGNDPFQAGLRRIESDADDKAEMARRRLAAARARDEIEREQAASLDSSGKQRELLRRQREAVFDREEPMLLSRDWRQRLKDQAAAKGGAGGSGGFDRRSLGIMELARGLEDAIAGSTYGGIRGGIMAASNNISQFGMMFGPQGAIIGSLTSAAAVLGITLYDSWSKAEEGADKARDAADRYAKSLETIHERMAKRDELEARIRGHNRRLGGGGESAEALWEAARGKDEEFEQQAAIRRTERQRRLDLERDNIGLGRVGGQPQWVRDARAKLPADQQQKLLEADFEAKKQWDDASTKERDAIDRQKVIRFEQSTLNRKAAEQFNREADEQNHRARQQHAEDMAQEEERMGRARNWVSQEMLGIASADPTSGGGYGGRALAIEAASKERRDKINAAFDQGSFGEGSEAEAKRRAALDAADRDRMRQQREVRYGDLQADGASGFGSADIRSSQGMNAILKAMRMDGESKQIAELKRNGDVTEQVKQAIDTLIEVTKDSTAQVYTF